MQNSRLFDNTYRFLGKALDISSFRHSLISGNLANISTIGYKPKDIDFQKALDRQLQSLPEKELSITHNKHFKNFDLEKGLNASVYDNSDTFHLDTVDIDEQMSHLAENNIKYRSSVEMMTRKMKILKYSIDEGGR
ncbi:MAG: flagellar basal body rod protein FlgB [Deltaproteobacteria bacterium]|nr:MAG: flagellar basal body rod protein FlgB [Deltaproteobacteria bacterium]